MSATAQRIRFCGCIGGSVIVREGETEQQALARAESTILALFEHRAKSLSDDGNGPNVCLELDDNLESQS